MKQVLSVLFFVFSFSVTCLAQQSMFKFRGEWELSETQRIRFENNKVVLLVNDNGRFVPKSQSAKGYDLQESSFINKNNAMYSWINTCSKCGWTETQTYHFSYVTDNIIRVHFQRIVNNIDGIETPEASWTETTEKPKSFTSSSTYDIQPVTSFVKLNPAFGAASSNQISISGITTNEKATLVYFKLKNKAGTNGAYTLHAPGTAKAFYLTDQYGTRYQLTGQYGFGGFKTINLKPGESVDFICYFQRMPLTINRISIKEGDCLGNECWNFYEVDLTPKQGK